MTAAVTPVAALLLSVAFLLMGNGLQGTLLPVRANMEAFGEVGIGILGSAYFLGFAVGCLYGPHVVHRVGHIRSFAAMVAVASAVVSAHALIVNPIAWWLLRTVTGFCFAVLFMIIESWLNEKSTNENRGLVFSIYTSLNLTVMTLGQLLLIFADPSDFPLFLVASILVSLAAVPIALARDEAPAPVSGVELRLRHLYRLSPVGVVGCLAVGLANGSFWALAPVFAQGDGGSASSVAFFMSIAVIAGAVGQWPLGRLSDRIDRRMVIILASVGAAFAGGGMFMLAQAGNSGILLFAFAFGLFAFPLYALSVAHLNDFVEPDGYVEAAGGLLLVYAVGAIAGPLIAALAVRSLGLGGLFAFTACVHGATAAFALYRMRQRAPAPQEEQIAFVDALRVAQTVSTVDPLSPTPDEDRGHSETPSA